MCPPSHPVALLHIGAEFGFDTGSLGIHDSSTLVWSMGDTTGFGGHGDFMQGWQDLTALGESFDNCNGIGTDCAWNSFGTPDGKMATKNDLSPETMPPDDDVGFKGPIKALPGGNAVYGGSGGVGITTSVTATMPTTLSVPTTLATVTRATILTTSSTGIVMQLPPTTTASALHANTSTANSEDGGNGDEGDDSGSNNDGDGHDACEL